jgi:riboflavin transporter FmnP
MNNRYKTEKERVKLLVGVGVFAALATVISFLTSFIKLGFLSLDMGDIIIVLASYIYGPISGVAASLISSLCGMLYSGTEFWGFLMDFVSSATFSFVASFVYYRRKNFKFAIIGIYCAVLAVLLIMMPLNILITPLYTDQTSYEVLLMIPTLLLPFNFFKTAFNGGAVLLLYKPIVKALRGAKLIPFQPEAGKTCEVKANSYGRYSLIFGIVTVAVAIIGLVILAM